MLTSPHNVYKLQSASSGFRLTVTENYRRRIYARRLKVSRYVCQANISIETIIYDMGDGVIMRMIAFGYDIGYLSCSHRRLSWIAAYLPAHKTIRY